MRTRAAISASLASLGILAVGWQAGAQALEAQATAGTPSGTAGTAGSAGTPGTAGTTGSTTASGSSGAAGTTGSGSSGTSSGTTTSQASPSQSGAQTYAGKTVSTRYGDVQVQITVQSGKITEVTALHLTDAERRSQMISATAAPILRSEVLQAQTGNVQTVSGATITSDAYLTSLQAALDAAHL